MTDKEREAVRAKAITEAIGLAAFLITLIAYQATIDPTFRQVWAARLQAAFGRRRKRDTEAEALAQVQQEISWMEHGRPAATLTPETIRSGMDAMWYGRPAGAE